MPQFYIQPKFLGQFFSNIKNLQLEDDRLKIEYKNGQIKEIAYQDIETYPQAQKSILNSKLSITARKTRLDITWLPANCIDSLVSYLNQYRFSTLRFKNSASICFGSTFNGESVFKRK